MKETAQRPWWHGVEVWQASKQSSRWWHLEGLACSTSSAPPAVRLCRARRPGSPNVQKLQKTRWPTRAVACIVDLTRLHRLHILSPRSSPVRVAGPTTASLGTSAAAECHPLSECARAPPGPSPHPNRSPNRTTSHGPPAHSLIALSEREKELEAKRLRLCSQGALLPPPPPPPPWPTPSAARRPSPPRPRFLRRRRCPRRGPSSRASSTRRPPTGRARQARRRIAPMVVARIR